MILYAADEDAYLILIWRKEKDHLTWDGLNFPYFYSPDDAIKLFEHPYFFRTRVVL